MLNLDSIAVEPELATKGVWANFMGGRFLLARPGPAYQARLVELYKEDLDLIKSETPEGDAKAQECFRRAFAETLLLDWDDIVDKEGNQIEYTPEKGVAVMNDPRQYELVRFLEDFVNVRTNYQLQTDEEVAKDVKSSAVS